MVSGYLFVPKQESGGVDDREKILCRGQEQACALGPKLHLNRSAETCLHVIHEQTRNSGNSWIFISLEKKINILPDIFRPWLSLAFFRLFEKTGEISI